MTNIVSKYWHKEEVVMELLITYDTHVFVLKNNIIVTHYKGNVEIDIDKILHVNDIVKVYTKGVPAKHLFIACPELYLNAEVRKLGLSEELNKVIKSAIVCDKLAYRIIGTFLVNAKKMSSPTKLFEEVEEALIWLKENSY